MPFKVGTPERLKRSWGIYLFIYFARVSKFYNELFRQQGLEDAYEGRVS